MKAILPSPASRLSAQYQVSRGAERWAHKLCALKRQKHGLLPPILRQYSACELRHAQSSTEVQSELRGSQVVQGGNITAERQATVTKQLSSKKSEQHPRAQRSRDKTAHKPKLSFSARKGAEDTLSTTETSSPLRTPSSEVSSHQGSREPWQTQKEALKNKFGEQGWSPRKKLSPDTMEGIRALHEQYPDKFTTPVLAEQFKISPEAIRRILKSKWRPSTEKLDERRARWAKRHDRIWDAQSEMGLRPKRTRDRQPESPEKLDSMITLMPDLGP